MTSRTLAAPNPISAKTERAAWHKLVEAYLDGRTPLRLAILLHDLRRDASDDERDRIEAYHLNVAGYIVKPVTFLNFCDAMATLNRYWTLVELP